MKAVKQVKEAYLKRGLDKFLLSSTDDLLEIHGVDIEKIKGIKQFDPKSKEFLGRFLVNFFNKQGVEERTSIEPVSFTYTKNMSPKIKFKLKCHGKVEWYFVASERKWY